MATHEDDSRAPSCAAEEEEQEQEPRTSKPDLLAEDDLVERMGNVVVGDGGGNASGGGEESGGNGMLPLRPYAGDCAHYVRTGTCKFGTACRFNHPVKKTQQVLMGKELESGNSGAIECKYFSTAGGCKYGKSCRYSHPGEESETTAPVLNFLGLPMRPGEKECNYYMRTGNCAYGNLCVYHHPDPTTVSGSVSPISMNGSFEKRVLSENYIGGPLHLLGSARPFQAPWFLPKLPENVDPYSRNLLSSQWVGKQSDWNGYQESRNAHQVRNYHSAPIVNSSTMETDEFPERPGQPECDFFMKTGNCKFKSTCRFHHPKNRTPKADECALNENGLPLRPGRSICRHYERHQLCKFGPACMFDHPENHELPTVPDWSVLTPDAVSHDNGVWED